MMRYVLWNRVFRDEFVVLLGFEKGLGFESAFIFFLLICFGLTTIDKVKIRHSLLLLIMVGVITYIVIQKEMIIMLLLLLSIIL